MSDTKDFYDNLTALAKELEDLRAENQNLRTRLCTMSEQAERVVRSYDNYLEAKVNKETDSIKVKGNAFSQYLSGLDLLAKREMMHR